MMPTINLEHDDKKELRVVGVSVRSDMEAILVHTNRHPTLEEAERARTILASALATQPDRYAQGFERAREMAAERVGWFCARSGDVCANAIRNMEMPDLATEAKA